MRKKHNFLKQFFPTLLLIAGVALCLMQFMRDNRERITAQNEEYLNELTSQRAISIDNLIAENRTFIHSTAYLYGKSLTSPWADVAVIREYEENAAFDRLCFVDASGDDYTSRGVMANLADRDYFQAGMRGESGVVYVPESRVTGQKQIGFYSPVYYQEGIIGVMVGFYGEDYLHRLLAYDLFGHEGQGWLCQRDGAVIGSTSDLEGDDFFALMQQYGYAAEDELDSLREAFAQNRAATFTWHVGSENYSGAVVPLQQSDWLLIRTFPAAASLRILNNANREGVLLIGELVALFAAFGLYEAVRVVLNQRRMREQNRKANDISSGVKTLFGKFITLDLDTSEYHYIGDPPDDAALPVRGPYALFCDSLYRRMGNEAQRAEVERFMSVEELRKALRDTELTSLRVHAPIAGAEWFTYNYIVIERRDGIPRRLLIVSQDVTRLTEKEQREQQRLTQALDTAQKASRAKTEFLFNMSHDLRTPMNAIIGYTELAEREGVGLEEMRDYVRKIDASSDHLLSLINDILEMSRIESGKLTLEPGPTDLIRLMEETRELFASQMEKKGIDFAVDAASVRNRWVLCDSHRLDRVVLNLVSNAAKFTPEGGHVRVTLRQESCGEGEGRYVLSVKDDGIGMSEAFVEKLFTPFERERTSTVSRTQGTGLGLSISKSIVDLIGGRIEVITAQGKGTEFIVHLPLPLLGEEEIPRGEGQAAEDEVNFAHRRLLLVEDNEINREIARMILEQAGFELDTAENGQIAVDKVKASPADRYDAILMDIQMPVMDGYQAARAIRALDDPARSGIPIVAMTANAFQEDVRHAQEAGMVAHIAKPLDVDKMMKTLAEVLGKR